MYDISYSLPTLVFVTTWIFARVNKKIYFLSKFWGSVSKYKISKLYDGPSTSNRLHLLSDGEEENEKRVNILSIIIDSNVCFNYAM